MLTAESELDKSKAAYDEAAAKHNELLDRLSSLPSPGDDSTGEQKAIKEQIKLAESDRQTTKLDLDDKARRVKVADKNRLDAERELNRLRDGTVNTSAASQAALSEGEQRAAEVTKVLVTGVSDIVKQINSSYLLDTCFSLVNDIARHGIRKGASSNVVDGIVVAIRVCNDFVQEEANLLKRSGK